VYDDTAAIGKLYRRQDEIGTPFCVTVDVQSLEDNQVTIRERDSRHANVLRPGNRFSCQ
ncbi:MAG: His/Gly/Thr/Pro-type tRNA ligase C-terminal domain-containing protein, partial [Desulfobacterota bacterium]|nr:His/Gly/Thr/Pro-type tRNA ligase C-terminal domain-containing protein [Thermodesulfobacteriota bacterium]